MTNSLDTRIENLILGALVADASAMGLHWIYDQAHIRSIAPSEPEFHAPDAANYVSVPGYFAHAGREVGAQSQYGEQTLVMVRSLGETGGKLDAAHFRAAFDNHFGYGGGYVGYIDHATRETLNNIRRADDEALRQAKSIPFNGDPAITTKMVVKALSILKSSDKENRDRRFEEAIRLTNNDDAIVKYGFEVLAKILKVPPATGADDVQLPAIAKLPALVGALVKADVSDQEFVETVETAIRITNNNETAIAYGQVAAAMMRAAVQGADAQGVVEAGINIATDEIKADINSAISQTDKSVEDVTTQFGMACDLSYAIPSISHNLITAQNFAQAVRSNIYAGGDNCGRSILVGAVMGAIHSRDGIGIPADWIKILNSRDEILALQ